MNVLKTNADGGNKKHEWVQIPPLILLEYFAVTVSCVSEFTGIHHPVCGALQPALGEPLPT